MSNLVARRLAASSSGERAKNGWEHFWQTTSVFTEESGTSLRWPQCSQVASMLFIGQCHPKRVCAS